MEPTTPKSDAPVAGAQPKSALISFDGSGIVLNTMEQAFIFAKAVIGSGLAPKNFQTPEAVLIAVQMGAEIGLPPMTALQGIAVINGKPGVYGDTGKAILRAKGFDIEEMDTAEIAKLGFARCTITHPRQKPVTRTFSKADAEKAGLWGKSGPWSQYPWRQMAWRAFWFAARDAGADYLKGVGGAEELRDTPAEARNVTPPAQTQRLAAIDAPLEMAPAPTEPATTELPFEGDEQTRADLAASRGHS